MFTALAEADQNGDDQGEPEVVEIKLSDDEGGDNVKAIPKVRVDAVDAMDVDVSTDLSNGQRSRDIERSKIEREINKELSQAQSEQEVMKLIEEKRNRIPRLEIEECLFCTNLSENLDDNIQHMFKAHSFFIPDFEYLVDLPGLIRYLGDKLRVANVCLYCNGRGRGMQSLEAARKHMVDKGHCKLAYDTEVDILELSDFYDFS